MVEIFEMVNGHAFPTVHILMIDPFKRMWENDTSEGKANCIKDFTYVELVCSPRKSNIFYKYDEETREKKVKQHIYGNENHGITSDVMLATMVYKEELSSSLGYSMLNAALNLAHRVQEHLGNIDPNEKTPNGSFLLKPKEILVALQEVPDVIEKLERAIEKVNTDMTEAAKTRNAREINPFER